MSKHEKSFVNPSLSLKWHLNLIFSIAIFSAALIKNGASVIPEASQEGGLRSFKNYDDVVIFHFNVPKHVLRATWQFAAFMDNSKCPHRRVNIFLKWGSYPVISVNNATYPPNIYVEQNAIEAFTMTDFEPKTNTVVPVYSPLPGDWFVSAYLSHWDENVHQKGLGHECRYSLGTVAIWSETNGIPNIPLGYQKTIRTTETISYYKLYIPMDTGSFQVDIWGCNFTLKIASNSHGPCIKNLALKNRVLPFHNHSSSSSIGNLTSMDTYTFTELSPFQDDWYYLMVVSNSTINFNIKVTVFDCPVKSLEKAFSGLHISESLLFKASEQLNFKDLKDQYLQWYSFKQSKIKQNLRFDTSNQISNTEDSINLTSCISRYQLVRIKYAETYSGEYLLQSREWLTSWLTLSDRYPVITQFDILPLVDIGGTLSINISLEMNEIMSKQQVGVVICISRGHMPKHTTGRITCDNRHTMMQLSTGDMRNASLLIPYPQPDMWYIAFQATCYVNGIPVHCEMEQILVSLSIKLRKCVFEGSNSCGQHGICQEIHKGLLYYTACKCFGGYQGWGCTDSSNAFSEFSTVMTTLALTLSNLFFIPGIYLAFKRKLFTEGLIYVSTMLFSTLYHACDQQFTTYCIAKYEVLQYCDFFTGILAFWATLVAMAELPMKYVSFFHMLGAIIVTFGVESDKTGLISILIPLIIGILIPLTSYGYNCFETKKLNQPKRIIKLTIGLSLAGCGILLFSLVETESNYQYVHSMWHICIAISLIFLLPPMNEDETKNNKSGNEFLEYKDSCKLRFKYRYRSTE